MIHVSNSKTVEQQGDREKEREEEVRVTTIYVEGVVKRICKEGSMTIFVTKHDGTSAA
jgi:hypothetical protein